MITETVNFVHLIIFLQLKLFFVAKLSGEPNTWVFTAQNMSENVPKTLNNATKD